MTTLPEFFGEESPLKALLPGFQPRAGQAWMAEAVADAIATSDKLVIEAGFGPDTIRLLEKRGHTVYARGSTYTSLQTVAYKDGVFRGASDPRRPNSGAAAPRPVLDAAANE